MRWLGVWLPVVGIGLLIGLVALAAHLGSPGSLLAYVAVMLIATVGAFFFSRFVFRIVEKKERQILRRNQELAAVNAVVAVVNESLDLNLVLNSSLEQVLEVTGANAGEIFLWDDRNETLVQRAFRGNHPDAFREITRFRLNEGIPGKIANTGEAIVIQDLPGETRFVRRKVTEAGFQAFAGVPLSAKGKVVGVMGIACLEKGKLGNEDLRLLDVLGRQIGIAIENARLYTRIREMTTLEERHRIAREMHDGLAQDLGLVHLKLSDMKDRINITPKGILLSEISQLKKVTGEAYEDIRQAIFGLKVMVSRGLGLVPTLTEYLHDFGEQTDIAVELKIPEDGEIQLSPHAEVQLIRMIQEALANVRKHAEAKRAWVKFERVGGSIEVTIRDNGRGFDPEVAARSGKTSFGLKTMRERAELVKGTFNIESRTGEGTRVIILIPGDDQEIASWNQ